MEVLRSGPVSFAFRSQRPPHRSIPLCVRRRIGDRPEPRSAELVTKVIDMMRMNSIQPDIRCISGLMQVYKKYVPSPSPLWVCLVM